VKVSYPAVVSSHRSRCREEKEDFSKPVVLLPTVLSTPYPRTGKKISKSNSTHHLVFPAEFACLESVSLRLTTLKKKILYSAARDS
jgi:hypothetical protein